MVLSAGCPHDAKVALVATSRSEATCRDWSYAAMPTPSHWHVLTFTLMGCNGHKAGQTRPKQTLSTT